MLQQALGVNPNLAEARLLLARIFLEQGNYEDAAKELQAVDAVAWAFFQKYERGEARFYDVIASKVIAEELIERRNWK